MLGSLRRVTPGHVGLLEDWQGNLQPYIYDDSQMVIAPPIWYRIVNIRLIPVKKRFIKEYKSKARSIRGPFEPSF